MSCAPALTGQFGGGLGPRHSALSHGSGLVNIPARDRRPPGTLVVPWDALTVGHPPEPAASAGRWLTLSYARPELVRRHGLCGDPRALRLGDGAVNAGFLGQVIDFYVANPDRRERIGTDAEYDDLCLRLGVVGARR